MTDPRDEALRHTEIAPAGRTPEPSFGADEEGEVELPKAGVTEDPAAWVHVDGDERD